VNSHQLVIRCDTTNGYYKVGWSSELPLGRFTHLELLLDSDQLFILNSSNSIYKNACCRVLELNTPIILKEREDKLAMGWLDVALNLNDLGSGIEADDFGCFHNAATESRYRLSKNSSDVWVVINDTLVTQIEVRYPKRKMAELEYQIWKNQQLNKLQQFGGDIQQGRLAACHSGLWFIANNLVLS